MKKRLYIFIILLIIIFLTGCNNILKPSLEISQINQGLTYNSEIPFYSGYVKNNGTKSAKFTEIHFKIYATKDKNSTIATGWDYLGEIAPGQKKYFKVLFNLPTLTDINNYNIKFKYD